MIKHAIWGRWAVAALFFINGFNMGAWAPQIPQMMERHGLKSGVMGVLIVMIGLGAVSAMIFAGKLIAPSAFYESFDQIHKLARLLLSPVVYAEDTDAIGTASANPVASAILAEEIGRQVYKRFGIRPFVTIARLEYESWTFLTRKHFEL